jgi:hypothetical protein
MSLEAEFKIGVYLNAIQQVRNKPAQVFNIEECWSTSAQVQFADNRLATKNLLYSSHSFNRA